MRNFFTTKYTTVTKGLQFKTFVPLVSVESYKLVPLYFNKSLKKSYHRVQGKAHFLAKPGETRAKPVGTLG